MNKFAGALAGLLVPAFFVAVATSPALAQDKKAEMKAPAAPAAGEVVTKEIEQNDKLRIYEATFKPGDVSPSAKRPLRAEIGRAHV